MKYPPIQWAQWIIIAFAVTLGAINLVPSWRMRVREHLVRPERTVLSQAEGILIPGSPPNTVIKVQNQDHISLEVYAPVDGESAPRLIYTIDLPESRDAYFNYSGVTTNLVLADIDHDGQLEIVSPSFDDNLIPRLRVYKYDMVSKTFYRVEPGSVD